MPSSTSTAAVMVVVVMAGVRRVVVRTCGSRVAVSLSRVSGVPARFGDYYYPGVDYAGDPAEDCEDDVEQERTATASAQEDGEGWEEDCYEGFAAACLEEGGLLVFGLVGGGSGMVWGRTRTMVVGLVVLNTLELLVSYY
jgi:hypothetical protein